MRRSKCTPDYAFIDEQLQESFALRFEESCDGLGTSWLIIKHWWVKNRWLLYHFPKCLFNEKRESTAAPCFFHPNVWTYFSVPREKLVLNEPFKMERSYFLFIYNPFALQESNGNFKWKKIEQNRKIFFVFFFLFLFLGSWFIGFVLLCCCCRFFFLSNWPSYSKLSSWDLYFETLGQSIIVQWPNPTRLV